PVISPDDISRVVALRMTRQEVLYREDEPPRLWVILDESALHRVTGSDEIMRAQLRYLAEAGSRPNIVIQVIPNAEGPTAAGGRSFILITPKSEPTVAYLEDVTSARYLRRTDDVVKYGLVFDHLRSSALSDAKSVTVINEVAKKYGR